MCGFIPNHYHCNVDTLSYSYFAYIFARVAQSSSTVDVIGAACCFCRWLMWWDSGIRPQPDYGWAWPRAQRHTFGLEVRQRNTGSYPQSFVFVVGGVIVIIMTIIEQAYWITWLLIRAFAQGDRFVETASSTHAPDQHSIYKLNFWTVDNKTQNWNFMQDRRVRRCFHPQLSPFATAWPTRC